jgi:hypothetical protein
VSTGLAAAPPKVKVLGMSSTAMAGAVTFGTTGIFKQGQPYVSFGFRVRAPAGQKVNVFWSVHCYSGSKARSRTGSVNEVGRGGTAVTFWRARTLARAGSCGMTLIATRSPGLSGRLIATILGRR